MSRHRHTDHPPRRAPGLLPGASPVAPVASATAAVAPSVAPSAAAPPASVPWPSAGPPPDPPGPVPGLVVGVVGARGGAGASVLAVALAREAALRRRPVALLDADPLGGGIDALLGAETHGGLRWPDLVTVRGRLPGGALLSGLPVVDGIPVVSWDREAPVELPAEALAAVVDGLTGDVELLVVDLPRRDDPGTRAALDRCDVVLLLVPAEVRAAWAAGRLVHVLRRHVEDVRLVVRGPAPGGLRPAAIAETLGLPLAGELRPEPGLAAALERAEPPGLRRRGPLAALCRRLLAELPAAVTR